MERIAKLPKKALILRNVIGAFIVFNLFVAIPFAQKGVESPKLKTVVIDAGHGGKDPGCHGGYAHEKDVCLSMALKLPAATSTLLIGRAMLNLMTLRMMQQCCSRRSTRMAMVSLTWTRLLPLVPLWMKQR